MGWLAASLIAGVGGWFGARWTVPLAAVLAQPVFWLTGFIVLIAWLGLMRHSRLWALPIHTSVGIP